MLEAFFLFLILVATYFVEYSYQVWLLFGLGLLVVVPGVVAMFSTGAPCVSTTKKRLRNILTLSDLQGDETVYDLGSGYGSVVRAVADFGVRKVIGFELSFPAYLYSKVRSILFSKKEVVSFANFWRKDLSKADVLICFLSDKAMLRFKVDVWPLLKKGTKIISNDFELPAVKADKVKERVYLYVKKIID
jgi:hypothetical protein